MKKIILTMLAAMLLVSGFSITPDPMPVMALAPATATTQEICFDSGTEEEIPYILTWNSMHDKFLGAWCPQKYHGGGWDRDMSVIYALDFPNDTVTADVIAKVSGKYCFKVSTDLMAWTTLTYANLSAFEEISLNLTPYLAGNTKKTVFLRFSDAYIASGNTLDGPGYLRYTTVIYDSPSMGVMDNIHYKNYGDKPFAGMRSHAPGRLNSEERDDSAILRASDESAVMERSAGGLGHTETNGYAWEIYTDGHLIYRYKLPAGTNGAIFQATLVGNYQISVSKDKNTWVSLDTQVSSGWTNGQEKAYMIYSANIAADGTVYVRIKGYNGASMMLFSTAVYAAGFNDSSFTAGDVTKDGLVTVSDLVAVKRNIVGLGTFSGKTLRAADVYDDRTYTTTSEDVIALKKKILALDTIPKTAPYEDLNSFKVDGYYKPGDGNSAYQPVYFKKPVQPDFLYVIEYQNMTTIEGTMIASLQGITAKTKPVIYINQRNYSHNFWLEDIKERFHVRTESVSSAWRLLDKLKNQVNGYILYDLNDGTSLNVAASLAGIYRGVMVDVSIQSRAVAAGLPLLADVRGLNDTWTFNQQIVKDNMSKKVALEQLTTPGDGRTVALKDYAIFCNAITFYQNGTSSKMKEILNSMEKDSVLLGWSETTAENVQTAAANNCGFTRVASDWALNLTVFAAFYRDSDFSQKLSVNPAAMVTENKHYVTIIMTDGDNIQWTLDDFLRNPSFWNAQSRGSFHMGFGINNFMYEVAPTVMDYYYKSASNTASASDFFVLGPHLNYIDSFLPNDARTKYIKNISDFMGKTGLRYMYMNDFGLMDSLWEATNRSNFKPYTDMTNIDGIFYVEYSRYDKKAGKVVWSGNGKPIVSAKHMLWGDGMTNANPTYVANKINSATVNPASVNGYSFITVHAWTYDMQDIADMIGTFNSNVKVVSPDEFMKQMIKNVSH